MASLYGSNNTRKMTSTRTVSPASGGNGKGDPRAKAANKNTSMKTPKFGQAATPTKSPRPLASKNFSTKVVAGGSPSKSAANAKFGQPSTGMNARLTQKKAFVSPPQGAKAVKSGKAGTKMVAPKSNTLKSSTNRPATKPGAKQFNGASKGTPLSAAKKNTAYLD